MEEKTELYSVDNSILNDAIDRVVVKLHGLNKRSGAKVFLLSGAGVNAGTTTVAINMAISLAAAGWKTAFVDCDFRKDQQYKRIAASEGSSLTGYLSGKISEMDKIICSTNLDNLDFIAAGKENSNPVRLLANAKMEQLIGRLKDKYDYVIIDTPSVSIANDAELMMPYVDNYMLVVGMQCTTKKQLVKSRLQLSDYEDKFIGVIANKMGLMQYRFDVGDYDYFSSQNLLDKQNKGMNKKKGRC